MKKILLSLFLVTTFVLPATAMAEDVDVLGDICQRADQKTAACEDKNAVLGNNPSENINNPIYGKDGIITKMFNIISLLVGVAAIISIITAGARFVTSGSNPEEVTKAREYVQYAAVALIVAAAAQLLIRLVLYRI